MSQQRLSASLNENQSAQILHTGNTGIQTTTMFKEQVLQTVHHASYPMGCSKNYYDEKSLSHG